MEQINFKRWMEGVSGVFDAECKGWTGTGRTQKTAVQRLQKSAKENLNAKNPVAASQAAEVVSLCKDWLKENSSSEKANLNVRGEIAWGR